MLINVKELRAKIYGAYGSQLNFSRALGWTPNKISRILKGKVVPDIEDCAKIFETLSMTKQEYCNIFLPNLSPNGDKFQHSNLQL